ncbi:hypothetical protein KUCAC02_028075 [Chaenocephalus aceratus]|uniref:Uncharacterized protein n=1 Tax=Chaenocephalus aceratus TaxID=36190 RepID=A0ACB9X1X9_CHAAC|nr:hypothetical protein KUCAC02_028075 [Chaenocephalus aceratus]
MVVWCDALPPIHCYGGVDAPPSSSLLWWCGRPSLLFTAMVVWTPLPPLHCYGGVDAPPSSAHLYLWPPSLTAMVVWTPLPPLHC